MPPADVSSPKEVDPVPVEFAPDPNATELPLDAVEALPMATE
jgi:hypothetical protein